MINFEKLITKLVPKNNLNIFFNNLKNISTTITTFSRYLQHQKRATYAPIY